MGPAAAGSSPGHPPSEVVIGIDVGTTAVKVSAFGIGSPWRTTSAREYPLLQPQPGWEVQQPDVVIAAVVEALAATVTSCAGSTVVALSLSSAMHGLIGLDAGARPLTPLITWADSRAEAEAAELRRSGLAEQLHRRSGTPVHPMSPLTKLIWLGRHQPDTCATVRHWVGLKDWVVWSLTATLATELSSASGTGLLDLATGTWSAESVALAGIRLEQLPPVLDTTAALGLCPPVAARVGLPATTPVVLGAGDGPLGNLGTGALQPGIAGLSVGTSGALRSVVQRPVLDDRGRLFCYALTRDAWVVGGAISNGGSVLRWAGEVFADAGPTGSGHAADDAVLALAGQAPPGCDGLVGLPYLLAERAPLWDPALTGGFLGMRAMHTRAHFVRACLEGVALQLGTILAELDRVTPVTQIRATGGVFRSPLWSRVLTDVLDRPITVTDSADGTALGAAALGLIGVGRAASLLDALALLRPDSTHADPPMLPDPAAADVYRQVRQRIPELLAGYLPVAELFR